MLRLVHRTVSSRRRERAGPTLQAESLVSVEESFSKAQAEVEVGAKAKAGEEVCPPSSRDRASSASILKTDADTQTDSGSPAALVKVETERRELSEEEEAQVLQEVGLDSPALLQMISRALDYERSYGAVLEETLTAAGQSTSSGNEHAQSSIFFFFISSLQAGT
jgi:hypothetical protein